MTAFNAVFAEGLGVGGLYSLNYERRFGQSGMAARVGFSYISLGASAGTTSANVTLSTVPITVSYLGIGGFNSKLELGAGGMLAFASGAAGSVGSTYATASGVGGAATVLCGYRYQPDDGGFQFRVGLSPLFGPGGVLPWGYISFGGAFGP